MCYPEFSHDWGGELKKKTVVLFLPPIYEHGKMFEKKEGRGPFKVAMSFVNRLNRKGKGGKKKA